MKRARFSNLTQWVKVSLSVEASRISVFVRPSSLWNWWITAVHYFHSGDTLLLTFCCLLCEREQCYLQSHNKKTCYTTKPKQKQSFLQCERLCSTEIYVLPQPKGKISSFYWQISDKFGFSFMFSFQCRHFLCVRTSCVPSLTAVHIRPVMKLNYVFESA